MSTIRAARRAPRGEARRYELRERTVHDIGTPLDGFDRTKIPTMAWNDQDRLYAARVYG